MTTVALNYRIDGPADGEVLVLGPSLGTSLCLWDGQMPRLTQRLRVVRYDHRGHGGSPVPPGPYSLADLGADVIALMDRLEIARAHVAGMSLGGMVGMWLAAHAPERVERLAVVCTSARLGPPQMWADRAATVRSNGLTAIADAVLARWLPGDFARQNPQTVATLRAVLIATPPEGYAACCEAIAAMDLEPDLATITAPSLVIAGLVDEATPPAHAQRIADGIADSRLALVACAAHLANIARPDLIAELLSEFLEESDAHSGAVVEECHE